MESPLDRLRELEPELLVAAVRGWLGIFASGQLDMTEPDAERFEAFVHGIAAALEAAGHDVALPLAEPVAV